MGQRNSIDPMNYGNDHSEPWSFNEDPDPEGAETDADVALLPAGEGDQAGTCGRALCTHLSGLTNRRSKRARSCSPGEGMMKAAGPTSKAAEGRTGATGRAAPSIHRISKDPKEKEDTYLQ